MVTEIKKEWFTITDLHGRSIQATRINGKLYYRYHYAFCGGEDQARSYMAHYKPGTACIYETFGSGLCMVLCKTNPELYTAYQPN